MYKIVWKFEDFTPKVDEQAGNLVDHIWIFKWRYDYTTLFV